MNNAGMAFRDQLRRLRQEKKLTQEQLALACGWGQSRIANYEAPAGRDNARNPDVDEVPLIAKRSA